MDSRKFKKADAHVQGSHDRKGRTHNRRSGMNHDRRVRKKKMMVNYKALFGLVIIVLFLFSFGSILGSIYKVQNVPGDAVLVYPSEFNMTPYGYDWNKNIYGYCIGVDENGDEGKYFFTLEQMAALYKRSHETFNYSDGIYVCVSNQTDYDARIVDRVYNFNGNELIKPYDYDEYKFAGDARFIGRDNSFCSEGFGFTPEEYKNSVMVE